MSLSEERCGIPGPPSLGSAHITVPRIMHVPGDGPLCAKVHVCNASGKARSPWLERIGGLGMGPRRGWMSLRACWGPLNEQCSTRWCQRLAKEGRPPTRDGLLRSINGPNCPKRFLRFSPRCSPVRYERGTLTKEDGRAVAPRRHSLHT